MYTSCMCASKGCMPSESWLGCDASILIPECRLLLQSPEAVAKLAEVSIGWVQCCAMKGARVLL